VRYVSPELVNLIEDNNFYYYDKEKSDVYILAMITLEIGNLRPVPYFNAKSKTFDFNATLPALQEFKIRYTSKLADIIEKMLVQEAKDRWKFEQIIENIENRTIHMNSEVT
jgi:serine/threonine protein kinase